MNMTLEMGSVDFLRFVAIWNRVQGRTTPSIHFRMAQWLERAHSEGRQKLLLMAFRSAGKSTIMGLFAAWLLYRKPNLRLIVVAADEALAAKMVRNVRRIIERHPFTSGLIPKNADQWAGDRFTVVRDTEWRDPSMMAKGVSSNVTGCRADIIIHDDVEVPNTCATVGKRLDLRTRLTELNFVLTNNGMQIYVGTPHTYHTIYADQPRHEIGEDLEFLHGFERFELPILNRHGLPNWPEQYTVQDIEELKRQTGPNTFASQMMLKPVNIAEGRLDSDLLQIYDDDLHYDKILRALYLGAQRLVGVSAWWDPAFGAQNGKGDHSVLAVVFANDQGHLYIHRVEYINIDACRSGDDEATAQCRIIAHIAKEYMLPAIHVETNGIGKFLPAILRNQLALKNVPCRVIEQTSRTTKDIRIIEAFEVPLAARCLFIHEDVLKTSFAMEITEWQPGSSGYDDGLDAVAGALSQQPLRLNRLYAGATTHGWIQNKGEYRADSDFKL